MWEKMFRIRFSDGGLDGGSPTGYTIRTLRKGCYSYWRDINIYIDKNDVMFPIVLENYRNDLLKYWNKHCNIDIAPETYRTGALMPHQYTATVTQPLWQNVYERIVHVNRDIRLGCVSNDTIFREIGIRLALLHVDPSLINRISNENTRLYTLSELSADYGSYPDYSNAKITERPLKWNKEFLESYGSPVDCPVIDGKLQFCDRMSVEEIRRTEQETGYVFYYIIPHAGRMYGLYVNPAHPETWAGDRRVLNSGNYQKPYGLKPILRYFPVEGDCKIKHVLLPLCNCMGKIRINTWDTKLQDIY